MSYLISKMNLDNQKTLYESFQFSYQTGGDVWSHFDIHDELLKNLPIIRKNSFVLDLGSGRGFWLQKLSEHGYKVIGTEVIDSMVEFANQNLINLKLQNSAKVIRADVKHIPFHNYSFELITDILCTTYFDQENLHTVSDQINNKLKKNGYYLNVSFSRETSRYLDFSPKSENKGYYQKYGIDYYFYTDQEIIDTYSFLKPVKQFHIKVKPPTDPLDELVLLVSIFKKTTTFRG